VTASSIASGTIQQSNLAFTPVLSVGASAPLASSGGQNPSISLTGSVAVASGGTGAGTAAGARINDLTGRITPPGSEAGIAGPTAWEHRIATGRECARGVDAFLMGHTDPPASPDPF